MSWGLFILFRFINHCRRTFNHKGWKWLGNVGKILGQKECCLSFITVGEDQRALFLALQCVEADSTFFAGYFTWGVGNKMIWPSQFSVLDFKLLPVEMTKLWRCGCGYWSRVVYYLKGTSFLFFVFALTSQMIIVDGQTKLWKYHNLGVKCIVEATAGVRTRVASSMDVRRFFACGRLQNGNHQLFEWTQRRRSGEKLQRIADAFQW